MSVPAVGVELDDSPERVQFDVLWSFLSTEATWGRWRSWEIVESQVASAWRVVGAYDAESGEMVGFARAVSDGYATAYLADVFVVGARRGRGIASAVVDFMINHGPGRDFRWMLHTVEAHGLYARLGFGPADHTYMERPSPLAKPSQRPLEPGTGQLPPGGGRSEEPSTGATDPGGTRSV